MSVVDKTTAVQDNARPRGGESWALCLEAAETVARQAGVVIREAIKGEKQVMVKSSMVDLVTETDQKVEKLIINYLKQQFPTHSFIGEESVADGQGCSLTNNPTWIIDPVDGTTNFVHGFPFVAVSIGLAVNKKVEVGVVYSCVADKMYTARKGHGAFCNGRPLKVSKVTELSRSLLITEMGSSREPESMAIRMENIHNLVCIPCHGIRQLGSAALNLCSVAAGEAEAYFEFGIHCWDMAAGVLLVEEAGGVIVDTTGGPFDLMSQKIIAANCPAIATSIADTLKEVAVGRDGMQT
uniref:inositol monophosphatase 1 isoform X2 n=2 Tax=Myxine glutinosa TaxID=7769 RepID=UPI00358E8217